MNKKELGLSAGLASVIAVGAFVSPYLSSTTLVGNNSIESNQSLDSKYSATIKNDSTLSQRAEEKGRALSGIRNSQVRNVLNNSTKTISKKQNDKSKEEINSETRQEKTNKQELITFSNNVSTYKNKSEKVDTRKDSNNKEERHTKEVTGKTSVAENSKKSELKEEKSEVASLTLSRSSENEEEEIYSDMAKSTTGDLFVRGKADKDSEAMGVLPKDTKVVVGDNSDNVWAKIDYRNREAYVSKSFLASKKSSKKVISENGREASKKSPQTKTKKSEGKSKSSEKLVEMWVRSPICLRSDGSISSDKLGVLEKNIKVKGKLEDRWFKASANGKNGFINLKYLQNKEIKEKAFDEVQTSEIKNNEQIKDSKSTNSEGTNYTGYVEESVDVRDDNSMNSNVVSVLEKDTKVSEIKGKYWIKISGGRCISASYVRDDKVNLDQSNDAESTDSYKKESKTKVVRSSEGGSGSAVAQAAYNYLGDKYVWGSAQPGVGFDCSGLTSHLYNKVYDISFYRNSAAQLNNGCPISKNDLKQGNLLLFSTDGFGSISCADIYVGNGKMIHASTPSTGVIISGIDSNHYSDAFVTARRIPN